MLHGKCSARCQVSCRRIKPFIIRLHQQHIPIIFAICLYHHQLHCFSAARCNENLKTKKAQLTRPLNVTGRWPYALGKREASSVQVSGGCSLTLGSASGSVLANGDLGGCCCCSATAALVAPCAALGTQ